MTPIFIMIGAFYLHSNPSVDIYEFLKRILPAFNGLPPIENYVNGTNIATNITTAASGIEESVAIQRWAQHMPYQVFRMLLGMRLFA